MQRVVPELVFAEPELDCVEPIDDLTHQIAYFVIADPGHLRLRDLSAGRIGDCDIGVGAGVTDHARTGRQLFQSSVSHADQRHGFCHDGGDLALKVSRHGFPLQQRG